MNSKRIIFRIGITLTVLIVLTAPAAADNVITFDPDVINLAPGERLL